MKRIYCIILISVFGITAARAQWDSIGFVDRNLILTSPLISYEFENVFVGTPSHPAEYGDFFKSTDGLNSFYTLLHVGGYYQMGFFGMMDFLNDTCGYITYGSDMGGKLVQTTDGGETFTDIAYGAPWFIFSFLRPDYGYYEVDASDNALMLYNNGVVSQQDTSFIPQCGYLTMKFINDSTGFVVVASTNILYRTIDYGKTWSHPVSIPDQVTKFFFTRDFKGYVLGVNDSLYSSADLGATWTCVSAIPMSQAKDIFFLNSDTGWAAGTEGKILKTVTGGQQWVNVPSGTTGEITKIGFFTSTIGYFIVNYSDYSPYTLLYRTHSGPWGFGEKEAARPLRIIENPVRTKLRLTAKTSPELITSIEIISTNGKVVYNPNSYSAEIDVSTLPAGLYLFKYNFQGRTLAEKFIIEDN
jgi:hypothetical protein